jgi:hypothetical protein
VSGRCAGRSQSIPGLHDLRPTSLSRAGPCFPEDFMARRANHFRFTEIMSSPGCKNFLLFSISNRWYDCPIPPGKGTARDRHEPRGGVRWTPRHALTSGASGVRRSRVVLAPRPWRLSAPARAGVATVTTNAAHRGARISRKAIARGKPGCLGCTCQIRVRSSLPIAHGAAGAVGARLSLRPLFDEGQRDAKAQAKSRRENENACFHVYEKPSPLVGEGA